MWFQFKQVGSRELNVELQVENIEGELENIIDQLDRVFVVSDMNCDLKTGKVQMRLVPGNGFLHVVDRQGPIQEPIKHERKKSSRKGQRWYTHAERQYLNNMFVRYKGYNETIVAAANFLPGRSVDAIERQWNEFVNRPHKWSEWIKGGKR